MKVLIHYGDRIEEVAIDCSEAPLAIEMMTAKSLRDFIKCDRDLAKPSCSPVPTKAFLSGIADGFPIYRFTLGPAA
jgi:hypothetical protein